MSGLRRGSSAGEAAARWWLLYGDDPEGERADRIARGVGEGEPPDEVLCEIQCPECGDWLHPTAYVYRANPYRAATVQTEHDLRCGCHGRKADDAARLAYVLALEGLVHDELSHGYGLPTDSSPVGSWSLGHSVPGGRERL